MGRARRELRPLEFPPADDELIARADAENGVAARRSPTAGCATSPDAIETRGRRLGEVAMDVAERDRTRQRAVTRRRSSPADRRVPADSEAQRRVAGTAPSASSVRPTSRLRHAALPAMQHADDHFLPDVAALASG